MTAYLWTLAGLLFASELLMLVVLGGPVWALLGHGALGVVVAMAIVGGAIAAWALSADPWSGDSPCSR